MEMKTNRMENKQTALAGKNVSPETALLGGRGPVTSPARLRRILEEETFLTLPGIYDCLSARIAEEAGFKALFLSGGGLAVCRMGRPDIGFLNLNEFGEAIRHIAASVKVPLIADADNGFGNAIHAADTGRMYEQLGAAGIQIDDKVLPSLTPVSEEIVPWDQMEAKLRALRAAVSEDFVIIFRTVANLYGMGIEEAVKRINRAAACGADYVYVDGIKSIDELLLVSREARAGLLVNLNEKGFCGSVAIEKIREMNYRIGLFPISTMLAAAQGLIEVMGALARDGSTLAVRDRMCNPPVVHNMMGLKSLADEYLGYYGQTKEKG